MKEIVRSVFSPLLNLFESGTGSYEYKASYRVILKIIGVLFSGLATLVFWLAKGEDPGYMLPVLIFGAVGLVSLVVAFAGSDRAVAKIWGSR